MSANWLHNSPAIFLVGFMASGKSTVGPLLAARLQRPFIDLDHRIEAHAQCRIAELIQRHGEDHFRQLETATLRAALQEGPAVIAPGGGAITRSENRALLQSAGITIWFDAPFELCWERIQADGATRPLAANESAARERYEARLELYRQANLHLLIRPDQTAEALVTECLQLLRELAQREAHA